MACHYQSRELGIKTKSNNTPVTKADLEANQVLCEMLAQLAGGSIPIISEENENHPSYTERKNWEHYWLLDPLDGTREFINGSDNFTVNIALINRSEPIMGIVLAPAKKVLYYATRNDGAHCIRSDSIIPIQTRVIDEKNLTATGSKSWFDERTASFLKKLPRHKYISMGSSLKPCLIAEGKADIYARFGTTCEWDTAAAHCVLTEAGGNIYTEDGSQLLYNQKDSLLNPYFVAVGDTVWDWQQYLK